MKGRRFISVCFALLFVAGAALGAGNYQRTKDGKVTVWNGDPKPGDSAQWFGGHDKEGYASGTGTLIWYTGTGELYARYHGNMVRGKFDGPVDVRSEGRVAHAVFVDGKRTTRWAAGSATKAAVPPTALRAATVNAPTASATPNTASVRQQTPQPETADSTRSETMLAKQNVANAKTAEPSTSESQHVASSGAEPRNAPPSTEPPAATLEARQEAQNPASPNPGVAAAERPTPNVEQITQDIPAEGPTAGQQSNPPAKEPSPGTSQSGAVSAEQSAPSADKPLPEATRPTLTIQDKPDLADLSAPPAELRPNAAPDTTAENAGPDIASSPAGAQLTPDEAMELADTEARGRGYNLEAYQRPKADYSAVKGQWSFFYSVKNADAATEPRQHFLVTVDDSTRKTELNQ